MMLNRTTVLGIFACFALLGCGGSSDSDSVAARSDDEQANDDSDDDANSDEVDAGAQGSDEGEPNDADEADDAASTDEAAGADDETTDEASADEASDDPASTDDSAAVADEASVDTDDSAALTDDDSAIDIPSSFTPPDPILPDEEPDTPVSELGADDQELVCEAYLETVGELIDSLDSFCQVRAIQTAEESGTDDTEAYRAACAEDLLLCETEMAAAQDVIELLECNTMSCSATLEQFDGCRAQVSALNTVIFSPLADLDAPSCDEVTPAVGEVFALRVGLAFLGGVGVLLAEGGDVLTEESPCEAIEMQCPDFAAPVDGLGLGGLESAASEPAMSEAQMQSAAPTDL